MGRKTVNSTRIMKPNVVAAKIYRPLSPHRIRIDTAAATTSANKSLSARAEYAPKSSPNVYPREISAAAVAAIVIASVRTKSSIKLAAANMADFACFQNATFSGFQKCIKNLKIGCIYSL